MTDNKIINNVNINEVISNINKKGSIQFIIGRPGTGKASTVIEIIKKLLKENNKITFITLELEKNILEEKYNLKNENINIIDKKNDLKNIEEAIYKFNTNILVIDYYELLETIDGVNFDWLKKLCNKNINIIINSQISKNYEIKDEFKHIADKIYIINEK